jgi:hypothetical protein
MTQDALQERLLIREVVEEWAVTRDAALWDRFRRAWHADGYMMATWFQGPAEDFIKVSRAGFEQGVSILHFLGGSMIDVAGEHAVAQTKMQILQRAAVDGIEVDVTCQGRFHDFFARRDGRWGIVLRRLTYEKDWLVPVDPSAQLSLEPDLLARFPVGYRHLAYVQTKLGFNVHQDMPGIAGPGTDALYEQEARWLRGDASAGLPPG